jgi:choline dehydrogenase-like flavoprotein
MVFTDIMDRFLWKIVRLGNLTGQFFEQPFKLYLSGRSEISHTMIKSANLAGYPYVDYNSDFQMGVSYLQAHSKNGWRVTSGNAYLQPIAHLRRNLHVLPNSKVTKILINSG